VGAQPYWRRGLGSNMLNNFYGLTLGTESITEQLTPAFPGETSQVQPQVRLAETTLAPNVRGFATCRCNVRQSRLLAYNPRQAQIRVSGGLRASCEGTIDWPP